MRGGASPLREQVVRLGSFLPVWGRSAPPPREFVQGWQPLRLLIWALRPKPRVTFVSRRKSPKACQNLRFWTPSVRGYRPFRARCASRRATFCHRKRPICHFELGGQTGLYFSPRFCRENFLLLIRGAVEEWLHVWMQLLGGFGV